MILPPTSDTQVDGPDRDRQLLEYRAILEHAGIAVIFTKHRCVEHCNQAAERLFGWPPGGLTGQPGRVFYASDEVYATLGQIAGPILAAGNTYEADVEFAGRDGHIFFGHVIARAIDPKDTDSGTIWIASDVTAAREEKLRQQRLLKEQQQIFDRAEIGIAFIRDRIIQRCNRRFEEMIGFSAGEAVGKSTRTYFSSDDEWKNTGEIIYRSISETGVYHGEWPLQRLDGKSILCRFSGSMLDPEHPEYGYVWLHEDVSEQRAMELALQDTHRELGLIFDNAMIGVSYQRDRIILRCNRRLEEIFGWPAGGLAGQSTRALFSSEEDWAEAGKVYASLSDPTTYDGVMRYAKRDGTPIWVHIVGKTIEASKGQTWIWSYEDVTVRRATEIALTESMREYERIFENALVGMSYMRDRMLLRCNRRFEEIFGYDSGELTGKSMRQLYVSDDEFRETARRVRDQTDPLTGFSGEIRYRRRDGRMIWVQVNGRPLRAGDHEDWIWTHQDVTRAHDAEEALLVSHNQLEQRIAERTDELRDQLLFLNQLIEAIPGPMYYTGRDGRFLGCNQAYAEYVGVAPDELRGKTVYDIAPPDLAARYKTSDDDLLEHPGSQVYESQIARRDGTRRDVMFHKATFTRGDGSVGGVVGVMLDITARKQMEEALEENREKYRALSEAAFEAIFISEKGRCIELNRRAELMFGYATAEAIGRHGTDWIAPQDRDRVMANMMSGMEQPYEALALRKDGTTFPSVIRGRMAAYKGKTVRVTSLTDITDRKAAECALERSKAEVEALNASLEHRVAEAVAELEASHQSLISAHAQLAQAETLASLGRMVAVIAHELNTPIGNARLAASTLRDQSKNFMDRMASGLRKSELVTLLNNIETGTRLLDSGLLRAAHLISSFKQIAVDQTTSQRRMFTLDTLVDEISTTLEPSVRQSGCTLTWEVAPGLQMDSYPGPLGQVLINLIDNATLHAFDERSPGCIAVACCRGDEAHLLLTVTDDGVGIASQHAKRIFEPFFTTRLGRGGTGLGLSIVYNIVTGVLGGTISVSSTLGEGATFKAVLPIQAPTQGE